MWGLYLLGAILPVTTFLAFWLVWRGTIRRLGWVEDGQSLAPRALPPGVLLPRLFCKAEH